MIFIKGRLKLCDITEACYTRLLRFSFHAFRMVTFIYTGNTKECTSRINALKAPERESIVDATVSLSEKRTVYPRIWIQVNITHTVHSYTVLFSFWKWLHIHNLQIFHTPFFLLLVVHVPKQKCGFP